MKLWITLTDRACHRQKSFLISFSVKVVVWFTNTGGESRLMISTSFLAKFCDSVFPFYLPYAPPNGQAILVLDSVFEGMGNPVPWLLFEALSALSALSIFKSIVDKGAATGVKFPNVVGNQHVVIGCHWHFALLTKKYRLQKPIAT